MNYMIIKTKFFNEKQISVLSVKNYRIQYTKLKEIVMVWFKFQLNVPDDCKCTTALTLFYVIFNCLQYEI